MPKIRPFEERDYARMAEIGAAIDPTSDVTEQLLRHGDATNEPRVRQLRLVAEATPDGVIGWGQVSHIWWAFHTGRYIIRLEVHPDWQQRGVGSALFSRVFAELRTWSPDLVRADTRATRPHAMAFLEHRGFREWRRGWASVLDVASANLAPLVAAERRALDAGTTFTTYAEQAHRGDRLAHDVYEAEQLIISDEPSIEADSERTSFERFRATELDTPNALPAAHFLALDGSRLIGISRLSSVPRHPGVLSQAFTGTHPAYRGRGIAQALKLRTIRFAIDHGYHEIRTTNDSANAAMLHINEAIGFHRDSPIVIYERKLR